MTCVIYLLVMFINEPLNFSGRSLCFDFFFIVDVILAVVLPLIGGPCRMIFFFKVSISFNFFRILFIVFALIFEALFYFFGSNFA